MVIILNKFSFEFRWELISHDKTRVWMMEDKLTNENLLEFSVCGNAMGGLQRYISDICSHYFSYLIICVFIAATTLCQVNIN